MCVAAALETASQAQYIAPSSCTTYTLQPLQQAFYGKIVNVYIFA